MKRANGRNDSASRGLFVKIAIVLVLALGLGIGIWLAIASGGKHGGGSTSQALLAGTSIPDAALARTTLAYLSGPGKALDQHEQAASSLLALPSDPTLGACRASAAALDAAASPADALKATLSVPDSTLEQLILSEHAAELALLRTCGSGQPVASLETEVQRTHAAVMSRRNTLGAASGGAK